MLLREFKEELRACVAVAKGTMAGTGGGPHAARASRVASGFAVPTILPDSDHESQSHCHASESHCHRHRAAIAIVWLHEAPANGRAVTNRSPSGWSDDAWCRASGLWSNSALLGSRP